jgi:DNA helicase II / ATP-dependent DNA helicase PcrA
MSIITGGNFMNWDDGLQGEALEIASSNHTPIRVVAGPGTGKTYALKRRVAKLLTVDNIPPQRILVVTFTRIAANDLKKELFEMAIDGVKKINAGTLHSFCYGILREFGYLEITGRNPRFLLDFETRFMMEDLGVDQRLNSFESLPKRLKRLHAFEASWAREQDQEPGWPHDEMDKHFQSILMSWLKSHECILIGELIPETLSFLRNNPAILKQMPYSHILVDEYQDLNRAEQDIVNYIATNKNLMVVGDEDQSVYESFRHANPEGILHFQENHENTQDIQLAKCYRCPPNIVDISNNLIAVNKNRSNHNLVVKDDNPIGLIRVLQWRDQETEAQGIANIISNLINIKKEQPGSILVLCTRRLLADQILQSLKGLGIPSRSYFQSNLLDGKSSDNNVNQAQISFSLLTLLVNPNDLVSLRCLLGFGKTDLNSKAYQHLRNYLDTNHLTLIDGLQSLDGNNQVNRQLKQLSEKYRLLQQRIEQLQKLSPHEIIGQLFPEAESWAEQLRSHIEWDNGDFSLSYIYESLRTEITQPIIKNDVDHVRIMTLLKSKGLTVDHVFILGCVEGLIPLVSNGESQHEKQRQLEEQRRLFYVSITRPRRSLYISSFSILPIKMIHKMNIPIVKRNQYEALTVYSRFINELGPDCPRPMHGDDYLADLNNN